jgi:hypothetical protein
MMGVQVPGTNKLLLSDEAVLNVMRAVVSDKALGKVAFNWISAHPQKPLREQLSIAMARALIDILRDRPPCRFDPNLTFDHTAMEVATYLAFHSEMASEIEEGIGKDDWKAIVSRASPETSLETLLLN